MELLRQLVGLLINLGVPVGGVALFIWLRKRMGPEHPSPIVVFLLFAHYGAWLVLILTIAFWYWSGMATLGMTYLMSAGSVVMLVLAVLTYKERARSIYHRIVFVASAAHLIPVGLVVLLTWLLLAAFHYGSR